ncbi:hypothetical protein LTR70_000513 [Exophiala xenobiotica]|uniref:Uncharacterized protein n=1 Tax=Lithohypha guttulata TaxID=1690604 RepID=A0ABR0KB97_9EURO|nr:hypothetical protein LTR24_004680 [Lithohypha guttulata]KAK5329364.1 hypothetical protein LTR70_000513 [Exophiala xenobiotica]
MIVPLDKTAEEAEAARSRGKHNLNGLLATPGKHDMAAASDQQRRRDRQNASGSTNEDTTAQTNEEASNYKLLSQSRSKASPDKTSALR